MKRHNKHDQRGQIVIFMTVAFIFFVALLSIVLNSSIITAQKIKLQNTADLAAVSAANVQRENLNTINRYNRYIEDAWKSTQALLASPVQYPCQISGPAVNCQTVNGQCQKHCAELEDKYQKIAIGLFSTYREYYATQMYKIVQETNDIAYKKALNATLEEGNLPYDILDYYVEEKGEYPGVSDLINSYETKNFKFRDTNVSLKDILTINEYKTEDGKTLPLFYEKDEQRPFLRPKWQYTMPCKPGPDPGTWVPEPCAYGPLTPLAGIRTPSNKYVKVVKNELKEVFYFMFIQYQPLRSFNIFNIQHKEDDLHISQNPDRKQLFQNRQAMQVMALAKPDGGSLGEEEPYSSVWDFFNPGVIVSTALAKIKDFERNKIIPIADKSEIDFDLNSGLFKDTPYKKENVWH